MNHPAMDLLGCKVQDKITKHQGIVDSVCFDLYGCIQASVRGFILEDKDGKVLPGHWFDIKRLIVLDDTPVMEVPDFSKPEIGPAEKSARV